MKVLITGANGQLGQDLVKLLQSVHEVYAMDKYQLDITNIQMSTSFIEKVRPDVIIQAAAYTAVDKAETNEDAAYLVNAIGSRNIALAAEKVGSKICYISTDYVFDGETVKPYNEYDNTNPQSIYGKSKRAGEHLVSTLCSRYYIVRTSWLYGIFGNNFVKTMLSLGQYKDNLKVVNDQFGSPTYTVDLCNFIIELIATEKYGIYHASNSGYCSWYDFAKEIFKKSKIAVHLEPCTTLEFPRPAPRPKFSVMDNMAIRTNGFRELRDWREALGEFLMSFPK